MIALTLMLLSILVAATSVSLSWGYALGRNALKGVTQPDVRPASAPVSIQPGNDGEAPSDMVFWSESEIIEASKSRIQSAN